MKKLLASDLDGTLVHNGKLDDLNKNMVLKLQSENNLFGVSTGRPYNGVTFLKDYGIKVDFYVLLNGALILDRELKEIKHERIDYNIVEELYEKYSECELFGVDEGYETSVLVGKNIYGWENIHYRSIKDLKHLRNSLISINFSNKQLKEIENICESINNEYGSYVVSYRNSYFVDIVPKGCSKGIGVEIIAGKYKIDNKNIYTIGDSYNDVSMFNITGNSFAFHHCEEDLKKNAKFIVNNVAECIEDYMLGN